MKRGLLREMDQEEGDAGVLKLYRKSELWFALAWIGVYVVGMNIGLQFAGRLDNLAEKTIGQMMIPLGIGVALAVVFTVWIVRRGLSRRLGLCAFRGSWKGFLFFIPLIVMSLTNMKNGFAMEAPAVLCALMAANMAVAGYVEEIIFRGFLFRAMEKNGLRSAVIVSAVTFGAGHIVNLGNTEDTFSVLLQVAYAIVIGFLYTVIVHRGGSLWPCIISHMVVNASSVFAAQNGSFTEGVRAVFPHGTVQTAELVSAAMLMLVSGGYALWLWLRTETPEAVEE